MTETENSPHLSARAAVTTGPGYQVATIETPEYDVYPRSMM